MIKILCLPLLLVLSLNSAGAQTTSAIPLKNQENTLSEPSQTVTEVMHTLFRIIDSLHSRKDFTPEHISKVGGFNMKADPDDSNYYGLSQQLTPDWYYGLELTLRNIGNPDSSLLFFGFSSSESEIEPAMTDICTIDLDTFHTMLLSIGYENTSSIMGGPRRKKTYKRKEGISIDIYFSGESPQKASHNCIDNIWIYSPDKRGMK